MKAFRGEGKPAAGGISVDSRLRDPRVSPATAGTPHLHVQQLFVPGPSALITGVFERVWIRQVIRTGVKLFPDEA
jgi:hypothetical protein